MSSLTSKVRGPEQTSISSSNSTILSSQANTTSQGSGLEIGGELNLTSGIQVAQLALKHRQNKKQRQRIIVFIGSPIQCEKKTLETIGKKLKKNNVALDIVNFGEEDDAKTEKLEAFLAVVNSNDNSHIVHVPDSSNTLSDVLISSPIFTGDEKGSGLAVAAAAGVAAGDVGGIEFGVDPNLDPELALALRVSMEEERARQEAVAKRAAKESASNTAKEDDETTLLQWIPMLLHKLKLGHQYDRCESRGQRLGFWNVIKFPFS